MPNPNTEVKKKSLDVINGNAATLQCKSDDPGNKIHFINGSGTSAAIYVKDAVLTLFLTSTIMHELTHAHHYLHGNVYSDNQADAPSLPNAKGRHATEEIRTTGVGKFFNNPLAQVANEIEAGRGFWVSYGYNFGYAISDPWEKNSADDDKNESSSKRRSETPNNLPKTSELKLNVLREETDRLFFTNEAARLSNLQRTRGNIAEDIALEMNQAPSLSEKWAAQEALYLETMRLYQEKRYGAAMQLVKSFPSDMLAHLHPSSKAERLQTKNLCEMVAIRYRETVQSRLAMIRFDPIMYLYHNEMQAHELGKENFSLSHIKLLLKALGVKPPLNLQDYTSIEMLSKLSDFFERDVFSKISSLAQNSGPKGYVLRKILGEVYGLKPAHVKHQIPAILANFQRNRSSIDDLFLYRMDRSERISGYQLALATTPDHLFGAAG
jgi:hypothetical protein